MKETQEGTKHTQEPKISEIKSNETFECDLFTIVNHEGEFLIALGNRIVSKNKFISREEAAHCIDTKPWELILNATATMWDKLKEIENNKIITQKA